MRKFLVINMNYLGDALMTTPALAALRTAFPEAQIDTVVGAGAADVLRGNPDLNHIIPRTAKKSWERCVQVFRLLRQGQYSDVVILPPLPAYALTAWLARTPHRVGLANRGMDRFLTEKRFSSSIHMADRLLDTMPVPQASRPASRHLRFHVEPDALLDARGLLHTSGLDLSRPWIAVNVGATRPQKRWSAAEFAATLDRLTGIPAVIVGAGEQDLSVAQEIVQQAASSKPLNLVGRTTAPQLAALLSLADLLLTADSGPMHLATAVGTPAVALFGSTDPAVTGPYDAQSRVLYQDLSCAPCNNHPTCEGRIDCMRRITPDEAALAIRDMLRARHGAPATSSPLETIPLDILPVPIQQTGEPS